MGRLKLQPPADFVIPKEATAREAAALFGVSHPTILKWAKAANHTFPCYRDEPTPMPEGFFLPFNIKLAEACLEHGVGDRVMRRWAAEIGHVFAGVGRRASYREQVEDMKPLDAVEYLLDVLAQIDPDDSSREVSAIRAHGFTQREAVFLLLMRRSFVSRDLAVARLSVGRDLPITARTMSEFVVNLRRKLVGYPVRIITEPEVGYHITRDTENFLFPWEHSVKRD